MFKFKKYINSAQRQGGSLGVFIKCSRFVVARQHTGLYVTEATVYGERVLSPRFSVRIQHPLAWIYSIAPPSAHILAYGRLYIQYSVQQKR